MILPSMILQNHGGQNHENRGRCNGTKVNREVIAAQFGCGNESWQRSRLAPARRSYEGNPFDDLGSFVIALPRGSEAATFV